MFDAEGRLTFGRRRRRVRLHLEGSHPTVEGILDGKVDGWFLILDPRLLISADQGAAPVALRNPVAIDPARVVLMERL